MIDRDKFFTGVRASLFGGKLSQSQVDGMNYLIDMWEMWFEKPNPRDGNKWLAYCMATVFHETGQTMQPVEEHGGKPYGNPPADYWKPTGPWSQIYYGRGHVQLTWMKNYQTGQDRLDQVYDTPTDLVAKPQMMLENDISALVLFDGMTNGWFTGVSLAKYFNSTTEDAVNARRVVNGTDKAGTIASYYSKIKPYVTQSAAAPAPAPTPAPPATKPPILTITSDQPVQIKLGVNVTLAA
jgi:putative chitinase